MRVALISSEPVFRLGFRALIESSGDLQVVADATDARSGIRRWSGSNRTCSSSTWRYWE